MQQLPNFKRQILFPLNNPKSQSRTEAFFHIIEKIKAIVHRI